MSESNLASELDAFLKDRTEQQNGTQISTSTGCEHLNQEEDYPNSKMIKLGKCERSSYYNALALKGFLFQNKKEKSLLIHKSK